MKKKFDLYEALLADGFKVSEPVLGCDVLLRDLDRVDALGIKFHLIVSVLFSPDHGVARVSYHHDSPKRSPFKTKTHLNDRRAYNAIVATVKNNGFEF